MTEIILVILSLFVLSVITGYCITRLEKTEDITYYVKSITYYLGKHDTTVFDSDPKVVQLDNPIKLIFTNEPVQIKTLFFDLDKEELYLDHPGYACIVMRVIFFLNYHNQQKLIGYSDEYYHDNEYVDSESDMVIKKIGVECYMGL
ncbi:hypothetical protein [Pseudomonas aeruginosa]|uniref:hypothetical protein n=1 Tax=Pseudomonas aeruginosa TaxID=287 RepID=UPI001CA57668|nr:hypothetical protein [Pseudomonas aeruginosa]MBW6071495.1 hypothetical protein [Pseudomonas aeruginosa]USL86537.1 hypothetical protein CDGHABPJ_00073 [Pseudomonas phage OMKO1]WNV47984.1 hypothetical protein [Pseudomonas phage fMGyn-Pae01]